MKKLSLQEIMLINALVPMLANVQAIFIWLSHEGKSHEIIVIPLHYEEALASIHT